MTLDQWLDAQGFPHGFECIGQKRMGQVWEAAQKELRQQLAEAQSDAKIAWEKAGEACIAHADSIKHVALLRAAVMFAKDTTDRGEIASMMQEALTATEK